MECGFGRVPHSDAERDLSSSAGPVTNARGGSRGEGTPGKGATMGEMSSRIAQRYFAKRLGRGKLSFIGAVEAPQDCIGEQKAK